MRAIKNLESRDVDVSFEGWTYHLPKEKTVFLDDAVGDFVRDSWPKSFKFVKPAKDEVIAKADKKKTPSFINAASNSNQTDMRITSRTGRQTPTFGQVDETPDSGQIDSDGVGWYGEGLKIE